MIYTVFSHDESHPPRDFSTYANAQEYGDKAFGPNQYEIETSAGECMQKK